MDFFYIYICSTFVLFSIFHGMTRILMPQDVFLGSVGVACNKDALKDLDVTHILIVARSLEPAYPNDFIYKKIEGQASSI